MTKEEYGTTCLKHQPAMIDHAALYVLDRTAAEDVVAHAVEKGLKYCQRITRASFRKYMLETVRNGALDYLELHQHRYEVPAQVDEEGVPLYDAPCYPNHDMHLDIAAAIAALPARLREVAVLIYVEEWTQVEVAQARHCTQASISYLVTEINGHLRQALSVYAKGRMLCPKWIVNQ